MKFLLLCLFVLMQTQNALAQTDKNVSKIIQNELYAPTKSDEAKKYYNLGNAEVDAHNFGKAVEYFRFAVAADNDYIDAYDNMGLAFRNLNKLDSAEYYYLISRKKYPKGKVAVMNLAVVEEKRKNHQKSIGYYKQLLELDPNDGEGYYGLARQYLMLGKFDEALTHFKTTERIYKETKSPYIGDCYLTQCVIYALIGNKEMGIKYMTLAKEEGMTIAPELSDSLK